MTMMETIGNIQTQEIKARENYQETRDPKFLKMLLDCLKKREELLFKRLPVQLEASQAAKK